MGKHKRITDRLVEWMLRKVELAAVFLAMSWFMIWAMVSGRPPARGRFARRRRPGAGLERARTAVPLLPASTRAPRPGRGAESAAGAAQPCVPPQSRS